MAPGSASATGGQLLEELRRDLADTDGAIRSHTTFWPGSKRECLRGGSGLSLASSLRLSRPIATASPSLPGRYPVGPAGDFFPSMADGEGQALGGHCGRVAARRDCYGAEEEAVAFFDFFATPPPGFEGRALAVVDEGLRVGDSPHRARHAAGLLRAYEPLFWDTIEGDT